MLDTGSPGKISIQTIFPCIFTRSFRSNDHHGFLSALGSHNVAFYYVSIASCLLCPISDHTHAVDIPQRSSFNQHKDRYRRYLIAIQLCNRKLNFTILILLSSISELHMSQLKSPQDYHIDPSMFMTSTLLTPRNPGWTTCTTYMYMRVVYMYISI
jgi:hypothetical protein